MRLVRAVVTQRGKQQPPPRPVFPLRDRLEVSRLEQRGEELEQLFGAPVDPRGNRQQVRVRDGHHPGIRQLETRDRAIPFVQVQLKRVQPPRGHDVSQVAVRRYRRRPGNFPPG
jgi:hypothetical protein